MTTEQLIIGIIDMRGLDLTCVESVIYQKLMKKNAILLNEGARVFLQVCKKANVNFYNAEVLDIGCGTGHFAEVLKNKGVKNIVESISLIHYSRS